ncbi:MAG: hypothetical protein C0481_04975 [Phenylobacterium sp.]|nr:hypothetical protein [Phenylobacterium sp.]
MTALALVAGLSAGGAASAATQCRDAQGHFAKCASAPAKPAKCRDAKGHYAKCSSASATTSAMAAKTPPAAKPPTK